LENQNFSEGLLFPQSGCDKLEKDQPVIRIENNMKTIELGIPESPSSVVRLKYCDTFGSKLRGLMFTKQLAPDTGIIIVEDRESRLNAAIHMLFMNYDITVLWLDSDLVVVDKTLAKKWIPIYVPKQKAKYIVELHVSKFSDYEIGQHLILSEM
jgi:uncharacterized membrane protein (UPF0127 family)